jgi:uncharacterized cupredoxin-like copper-binding protein
MQRLVVSGATLALALVVAGCSTGGSAPGASSAGSPASSSPAGTRLDVSLTDALRIEPAAITVPAGVPVTFVVTNTGSTDHEFFLGDEAAQAAHEDEMAEGGMAHDEPDGITVSPGETRELTYTFADDGTTLAGCHLPGHYAGGMKAEITVED